MQVLYDCDNTMGGRFREVDDGLTILYLLGRPDIELVGVTTTFGNGPIQEVYTLTQALLHRLGRDDIPVYRGEGRAGEPPTEAAEFMARVVAERPGEIHILATGPLGNLYSASRIDPAFLSNVGEIACMGGYLEPLKLGWRNLPELNLSANATASHHVLNGVCPVTLMNAHICLQAPMQWGDVGRISAWSRETRTMLRKWLLTFAAYCGTPRFYLWDLLPAVFLSRPDLFDEHRVQITSTVDELQTGSLRIAQKGERLINMPTRILDVDAFTRVLVEAWNRIPV